MPRTTYAPPSHAEPAISIAIVILIGCIILAAIFALTILPASPEAQAARAVEYFGLSGVELGPVNPARCPPGSRSGRRFTARVGDQPIDGVVCIDRYGMAAVTVSATPPPT